MRVNVVSGVTLANDSFSSSYDNANERSWQVRHDCNLFTTGIPGLKMMNGYLSGDNMYWGAFSEREEWGRESELAYVIQSGVLKNPTVKWLNFQHPQELQYQ